MTIQIDNASMAEAEKNLDEMIEKLSRLETGVDNIKGALRFLTVKDVSELLGCSLAQTRELFNRPDFPVCDYPKAKCVFGPAFCEYFMRPVLMPTVTQNRAVRKMK